MTVSSPVNDARRCMKCGFCMSSCPVYKVDHIESHVARGRNMLVLFTNDGGLPADELYREQLSYCLLCGRCQATCPAKVPSALITAHARAQMVADRGLTRAQRLIYRGILKNRSHVARLLAVAAKLPGTSVKEGKPLRHLADLAMLFPGRLAVPRLSSPFLGKRLADRTLPQGGAVRGEVAIFPGCAFEFFFADAGQAMVQTIARAGFEVVYERDLTCCGLAVYSAGDVETARLLAQRNIESLSRYEQIVTGCATCSSALKHYSDWFAEGDQWLDRARQVSRKVKDYSEFLITQPWQPAAPGTPLTVTYHDPCHLRWHQDLNHPPREILNSMEDITFIEMEDADACCGLGGSFGIFHRDISLAIQAKKIEAIKKTAAQAVVTSCPGCMVQLMDGMRRYRLPIRVLHISQVVQGRTRM